MLSRLFAIFVLSFISHTLLAQDVVYGTQEGKVTFHSDAPHELIYATSNQLKGVLDTKKKTFVFKIDISSFAHSIPACEFHWQSLNPMFQ